MVRKLKTLGLVAAAALASLAVVALPAQAATFTASSYPTTVTATSEKGNGVMETEGGNVECEEHLEGTLGEASETIVLTPTFSECGAFGFLSATIHGNGCVLVVHSNGEVDLECPSGKVLEVTSGNCVMHVGSQSGLQWLSMINNSPHVDIYLELANLSYYVTKDGLFCPFKGTGPRSGLNWFYKYQWVTTAPVSGGSTFALTP
jgi:hypothetical protein